MNAGLLAHEALVFRNGTYPRSSAPRVTLESLCSADKLENLTPHQGDVVNTLSSLSELRCLSSWLLSGHPAKRGFSSSTLIRLHRCGVEVHVARNMIFSRPRIDNFHRRNTMKSLSTAVTILMLTVALALGQGTGTPNFGANANGQVIRWSTITAE